MRGIYCPIHGDLNYLYVVCDKEGNCTTLHACPKCRIEMTYEKWEKVDRTIEKLRIPRDRILGAHVVSREDVVPLSDEWRIYTYSNTLSVLVVNLGDRYYVLKFKK